jgi:hypothetical protein
MPVRKRHAKRANRAEFHVTVEIVEAFRTFIASPPAMGGGWLEHWHLHDLLEEAGALDMPLCPPCCWHPGLASIQWQYLPNAVAIYRRLAAEAE